MWMHFEIITRRIAPFQKDLPTIRVAMTDEVRALGIDSEDKVWVSVVMHDGKKYIILEPVENGNSQMQ